MARRQIEEWFWHISTDFNSPTDEFGSGRPRLASGRCWEPKVDLLEEESQFIIRAEIAGVRGDDIHLQYVPDRHAILLRGHRSEPSMPSVGHVGFHQLEIYYGDFLREVRLPDVAVDADSIRAHLRNGYLIVCVPKLERTQIPLLDESCPT